MQHHRLPAEPRQRGNHRVLKCVPTRPHQSFRARVVDANETKTVTFKPASSAAGAKWLESALRCGTFSRVSGLIPFGFEAYAVLRHAAYRCVSTKNNLADIRHGKHIRSEMLRWSEVAKSDLPVVYGRTSYEEAVDGFIRQTQFRRLPGGTWVRDILANGGLNPLIHDGDEWIEGPAEGCLEPKLARSLQRVLTEFTDSSNPCWFGIWEGFGFLSDAQRRAPKISTRERSWHLFRAPLAAMDQSFFPDHIFHHPANLVWPEDRSWCVATEIDVEATYVGGCEELIAAILAEPALESERVSLDDPPAMLRNLLQPVVEKPSGTPLPEGFEARGNPRKWPEFNPPSPMPWRERLIHWLLQMLNKPRGESIEFRAYSKPKDRKPRD